MNIRKLINTIGVVLLTIPLSVSAIQLSFFSKNPSSNNSLTKQRETPPTSGTDKIVKEPISIPCLPEEQPQCTNS